MKYFLVPATVGMMLAVQPLQAADETTGWSAGVAGVFAKLDVDGGQLDDNAVGAKVFAQYRFNRFVALEGAFLNSGRFSDNPGGARVRSSLEGFSGDLLAFVPVPNEFVDVYGKVGYFTFDQDISVDGAGQGRRTNGLTAGVGGRLAITERIGVRMQYDWYDVRDADFWTISIGVDCRFGRHR